MPKLSQEQKKELLRIAVSGVIFALIIIAENTGLIPEKYEDSLLMLAAYLIPYVIVGYDVLIKCFRRIANGQLFDETFLMTLATFGAFATGEYAEAVAVMLFYQVGEFFQDYAVGKSRQSIEELMDIAPTSANLIKEDGEIVVIDPDDVCIGDSLLIKPGDRIPVDGTVTQGESLINTSMLTGESIPSLAKEGDSVYSGSINGDSQLVMRADKEYDDSTVAQILELVEDASTKKSNTEEFITRFAKYYTPCVVIAALILAIVPPLFVGNLSEWILRACSFLVISCPCAIVISVPLAFFGGIGAASKIGVLVKGSNYLEMMSQLKILVSDKTGTLTEGSFKICDIVPQEGVSEEQLIKLAASLERGTTHPIAVSIVEYYDGEFAETENLTNVSGMGVTATVDGELCSVGNDKLMAEAGINVDCKAGGTVVHVAAGKVYLGYIELRDKPKEGVAQAIADIRSKGVDRIVMLTGDAKETAELVAGELGITEYYYELMPQDKVNIVEELLGEIGDDAKSKLAFVGDGINDAPVLARSDVGIAMGSLGSDAAIEAADIVIMDDSLNRIVSTIDVARKTVGISRANIVFALAVKALCLVLGAFGIVGMWAAVFADVGVAMICIINSMRLL